MRMRTVMWSACAAQSVSRKGQPPEAAHSLRAIAERTRRHPVTLKGTL